MEKGKSEIERKEKTYQELVKLCSTWEFLELSSNWNALLLRRWLVLAEVFSFE